jgi:hypothetical protein
MFECFGLTNCSLTIFTYNGMKNSMLLLTTLCLLACAGNAETIHKTKKANHMTDTKNTMLLSSGFLMRQ